LTNNTLHQTVAHPKSPSPVRPRSAFLAVTLLCNSKCVMCDIWKNKGRDFLPVSVYERLPSSLEMIDITGGEPFLRPDIPELVGTLRRTCPKARLLITTHGFMTDRIAQQIGTILERDPGIAFRVSLDGLGKGHDDIRGIPEAFQKVLSTLAVLRAAQVKDLGIIFTLMNQNKGQLSDVYAFCRQHKMSFSLNVAHDSPVYFGEGKVSLQPSASSVEKEFDFIFRDQITSINPRQWFKAWFNKQSHLYMTTHRRPLACGAGEHFFYVDSHANVYMCHFKNWLIGNLQAATFEQIWRSDARAGFVGTARTCHDCWMMCTAKDQIKEHMFSVLLSLPGLLAR
jgi:MoaA/NifB/PqqE/SkfB family radical SAM enzyme